MLEVINLCKRYKPKKGVVVDALKNVSIRFPEKGMVFLLGKSGSGKSTLLNLLGGLDRYDSGDICLDGVSTKDFSQADFDSYRNACLGFVFQEYNVLKEFSVGANIALAIELQGRRAEEKEIEKILAEVDLAGYARRRPNELSGGQLQRVAIARALVKNPRIIFADEPTGALDSATGRQVFETFKKLSETKLVIIVSHDREYSEKYADRIIELADGEVISDVEKVPSETGGDFSLTLENNECKVPAGYRLTEEDRRQIAEYIAANPAESLRIRVDERLSRGFSFKPTTSVETKGENVFAKIRSRLPMRRAARMGLSGLKSKKVRLVFTVLMSMIAFCLFGIASTLADYNYSRSVSRLFTEKGVSHVHAIKQVGFRDYDTGELIWNSDPQTVSEADFEELRSQPGCIVDPVYHLGGEVKRISTLSDSDNGENGEDGDMSDNAVLSMLELGDIGDWMEIDADILRAYGCKLVVGELPDGSKDEIAISQVEYDMIRNQALLSMKKVPKMSDMIGRRVKTSFGRELIVTGIIDTGLDYLSYVTSLTDLIGDVKEGSRATFSMEQLKAAILAADFRYDVKCNLASKNLVGKGFIERSPGANFMYHELDESEITGVSNHMYGIAGTGITLGEESEFDLSDAIPIAHSGTSDDQVFSCYVTRKVLETYLPWFLDENNRRYLGIDEAVMNFAKLSDDGNSDDRNSEDGETDAGALSQEGKDASESGKAAPSGLAMAGEITRREQLAVERYIESLSDAEIAELFGKIQSEYAFGIEFSLRRGDYYRIEAWLQVKGLLVGQVKNGLSGNVFVTDTESLAKYLGTTGTERYSGAMVRLPENRSDLTAFVSYTKEGKNDKRFFLQTKYNVELDAADYAMRFAGTGLKWVGIFFAAFAGVLLMSFIASSIVYKKRDVGILRAIGSRGSDVYRIFGSESLFIALICWLLGSVFSLIVCRLINRFFIMTLHVSLMEFGIRQWILLLGIAVLTAVVSSFIPVYLFARKRPIDAIRDR